MDEKQLKIINQELIDLTESVKCILEDQIRDPEEKIAYALCVISAAKERTEISLTVGAFHARSKWKIHFADGRTAYRLYSEEEAVEYAEKKKALHGGSYMIESVKKEKTHERSYEFHPDR